MAAAFALVAFSVSAQRADSKLALGVNFNYSDYVGDLGNDVFDFSQLLREGVGASLGLYMNPSFDAVFQGNWGKFGYFKDDLDNFSGDKLDLTVSTHYKFDNGYIFPEESRFSPFISLGVGIVSYLRSSSNPEPEAPEIIEVNNMTIPLGVGLKVRVSDVFAVQYKVQHHFTTGDRVDEVRVLGHNTDTDGNIILPVYENKKGNDAFINHMFSLVFSFNRAKDSDGDKVPDKVDRCPNTPANVKVDAFGCPLDTDGDGIYDYLDKCPDTPANVKVDADGCPVDTDKDGIPDYLDKCSDSPENAKVDANGCPMDSDKDGVPDHLDKCADTPANAKVDANGCPMDSDKDGVPDYLDKCADTPANVKVDANGCPIDSDKDGVPDSQDKCPNVPGLKENKGCPEIKEETKAIFDKALQGIQFESGKAVLKNTSFGILNQVVTVMIENPTYILTINGHTDSQGNDAQNLVLSKNRANAVRTYLISKGINGARLLADGFGETIPVADNATPEGRALNRRVEFKVSF